MDSIAFIEEIDRLRVKHVSDSDVHALARQAYANPEIRLLCSQSQRSLDEQIRVLAECAPVEELSSADLLAFLQASQLLRDMLAQDPDLVDWYKGSIKEQTALPVFAVDELATLIITSMLSGVFTQMTKEIITKLFASKTISKKDLRKSAGLFFANPILGLLEEQKQGLSVERLVDLSKMKPHEVGYYLAKYESEGWVRKVKGQEDTWKIAKTRTKILEGFTNLKCD